MKGDQRPRSGLMTGVVNAAGYLRRVSLGAGVGSTQVVPFRHARPLLLGSVTPDLRLGVAGFD